MTNAPSPYQAELFTEIASRGNIDLEVRFMRGRSSSGTAVSSRYSHQVMSSFMPARFRDEFRVHPRALRECLVGDHDVYVLSGVYTSVTFLACAAILSLRGKPWAIWAERPRPYRYFGFVNHVKNWGRSTLFRRADRVICIGSRALEEYQELGVPVEKLRVLPYCCDIQRFDADHLTPAIEQIRERLNLHGQTVFLFSGQMIERKGVALLLKAFAAIARKHPQASLVLLGDGVLRKELESNVPEDLSARVHFMGHAPQKDLPAYFKLADVFVFPSRHDGWAVVINEACAARLPVIATQQTGAAHDLVEEGRSGFVLDRDDQAGFERCMTYFLEHPEAIPDFGARSRKLVEAISLSNGAKRFEDYVIDTMQERKPDGSAV